MNDASSSWLGKFYDRKNKRKTNNSHTCGFILLIALLNISQVMILNCISYIGAIQSVIRFIIVFNEHLVRWNYFLIVKCKMIEKKFNN